jgi:hypothetical protein
VTKAPKENVNHAMEQDNIKMKQDKKHVKHVELVQNLIQIILLVRVAKQENIIMGIVGRAVNALWEHVILVQQNVWHAMELVNIKMKQDEHHVRHVELVQNLIQIILIVRIVKKEDIAT